MKINQLIADLYGCNSTINDPALCETLLRDAAEAVGATIVNESMTSYPEHGLTAIAVLAESHIMLTTWPEYDYAALDVLLCNPDMDIEVVLEKVVAALEPAKGVEKQIVTRGISAAPTGASSSET